MPFIDGNKDAGFRTPVTKEGQEQALAYWRTQEAEAKKIEAIVLIILLVLLIASAAVIYRKRQAIFLVVDRSAVATSASIVRGWRRAGQVWARFANRVMERAGP